MPGNRTAPCAADKKARWRAIIEEATVDCHNEYEEFAELLATLADRLEFPSEARVLRETVEVIGLDKERSSERREVVAKVRKGGHQYVIAVADPKVLEKDAETAEWLAAYRYWVAK
jgi:Calcium binding